MDLESIIAKTGSQLKYPSPTQRFVITLHGLFENKQITKRSDGTFTFNPFEFAKEHGLSSYEVFNALLNLVAMDCVSIDIAKDGKSYLVKFVKTKPEDAPIVLYKNDISKVKELITGGVFENNGSFASSLESLLVDKESLRQFINSALISQMYVENEKPLIYKYNYMVKVYNTESDNVKTFHTEMSKRLINKSYETMKQFFTGINKQAINTDMVDLYSHEIIVPYINMPPTRICLYKAGAIKALELYSGDLIKALSPDRRFVQIKNLSFCELELPSWYVEADIILKSLKM